jgi:adenylate kinase
MAKTFLIFFGPPGSGKGTQAEILNKKLGLVYISTGSLLRNEIKSKSKLGELVAPIVKSGGLVSDEIVNAIVDKRLKKKDAEKGAIFDGYPRNISQQNLLVNNFEKMKLDDKQDKLYGILIDVQDKEVKKRITKRRTCACGEVYHLIYKPSKKLGICDKCGSKLYTREDDKGQVIAKRLKIYHEAIGPLLDFWQKKSKLIKINGEKKPAEVQKEIVGKLQKQWCE